MTVMLCWNKVADFTKWKRVFDSHAEAHRDAELTLTHMWHDIEDFNKVFFMFEVGDIEKARSFVSAPDVDEVAMRAGVLDGAIWFLRPA